MADSRVTPLRPPRRCPNCSRRTADREHYPFCSARCRDLDLNRWLTDVYRLPGEPLQGTDMMEDGEKD